jgi:hypothetical protein
MSYAPKRRMAFGPPLRAWLLPAIYAVLAVCFVAVVLYAWSVPSGSWLFRYVVEGDAHRWLGARTLAALVLLGAIAVLARTSMRGVVIHADGIEARYVVSLGWPKVESYSWMQIDRIAFDAGQVSLQLWDGSRQLLPPVRNVAGLAQALEHIGAARAIPMRGETGNAEPVLDEELRS